MMFLDDQVEQKEPTDKKEPQEVKAEELPTVEVEKTLQVEQQKEVPVKPEVVVEQQVEVKKKKTLFDHLYKESTELKKRTISGVLLGVYLAIFFILALFSDNLMLVAASQPKALGIAPFVISLFLIGFSIWTVWYIAKEITKNFMVVKNHAVQRKVFTIMIVCIIGVTASYFWASYFWISTGGLSYALTPEWRHVVMIMFLTVGLAALVACSTASWCVLYKNGQSIKKSFIGAALIVSVTFFYIFMYYTICARNWSIMLLIVSVAFTCDMGAYFGGTKFGKRKLAPKTSPNKTWEGLFIGLCCGLVAGVVINVMYTIPVWTGSISSINPLINNFTLQYQVWGWQIDGTGPSASNNAWWVAGVLIPLIFAICAAGGDLIFSKAKRAVAIKDFGTFIPGHGGLLDRFDSVIFTTLVFVGLSIFFCLLSFGLSGNSPLLSNLATMAK